MLNDHKNTGVIQYNLIFQTHNPNPKVFIPFIKTYIEEVYLHLLHLMKEYILYFHYKYPGQGEVKTIYNRSVTIQNNCR